MTRIQAQKQSAAYRAAAAEYRAQGDEFVAERLTELADRIDAKLRAA